MKIPPTTMKIQIVTRVLNLGKIDPYIERKNPFRTNNSCNNFYKHLERCKLKLKGKSRVQRQSPSFHK